MGVIEEYASLSPRTSTSMVSLFSPRIPFAVASSIPNSSRLFFGIKMYEDIRSSTTNIIANATDAVICFKVIFILPPP